MLQIQKMKISVTEGLALGHKYTKKTEIGARLSDSQLPVQTMAMLPLWWDHNFKQIVASQTIFSLLIKIDFHKENGKKRIKNHITNIYCSHKKLEKLHDKRPFHAPVRWFIYLVISRIYRPTIPSRLRVHMHRRSSEAPLN